MKDNEWIADRLKLNRRVGRRQLRQALRYAKKGMRHPDPEVDALTLQWAQDVLTAQPAYPELQEDPLFGLKFFLQDMLTFGNSRNYQAARIDRINRKHARWIVDAHVSNPPEVGA